MKFLRQAFLAVACLAQMNAAAAVEAVSEARLKAGFIANFMLFVDWPQAAASRILCSFGPDRNDEAMEHLVDMTAGSALAVRRIKTVAELTACHAVYVGAGQEGRLPAVVAATAGRPVLIIAEFEGGAALGAMLSLVATGGGRLGFDANPGAARAAGLGMSSRLLQLARRVY